MSKEDNLFDYAERVAAKGLAMAANGAGPQKIADAVAAVLDVSRELGEFTSDDVRQLKGDFGFVEPRAWGVVMREAKKTGQVVPTDRYIRTGRVASHNRPMRVWRRALLS